MKGNLAFIFFLVSGLPSLGRSQMWHSHNNFPSCLIDDLQRVKDVCTLDVSENYEESFAGCVIDGGIKVAKECLQEHIVPVTKPLYSNAKKTIGKMATCLLDDCMFKNKTDWINPPKDTGTQKLITLTFSCLRSCTHVMTDHIKDRKAYMVCYLDSLISIAESCTRELLEQYEDLSRYDMYQEGLQCFLKAFSSAAERC